MTTTQPAMPADDMDMRGMLDDTMAKLGVKATPLAGIAPAAPAAPAGDAPPKPPVSRQEQLIGAGIGLVLLIIVSILWSRWQAAAPSVITPATTPGSIATSAPTAPPVLMLPAYGAPNEAPRWQIEATRTITPVAHFGADWIQADVAGSGKIWLKASDFPALGIVGQDLAPKAAVAPAAPPPAIDTPESRPPCFTAGTGNQQVTVCDWLSEAELQAAAAAKWVATYGGHVGRGDITPTPDFLTTPPSTSLVVRQRLIGSDPNALACQNDKGQASALCGGLTNAQAQAALDAEKAKAQP